jgi:hypothetical protein
MPIQNNSQSINLPVAPASQNQLKSINYTPLQHISNFKYEPTKERDT